ncbi:hypothetical protein ASG56_15720 [Rhodococcus sp. Leaf7]|uniref:TetR/AcrR family transcriptional regulator n=1 Tax=unclassified Rhodococcus (in: high G+C Gram-positive bacteria) TaxID=192944 RepID=UPI0006FF68D4|nr:MULTISPECIES: TetR/AcrR family transcriptional regulator [unclassified Rhodococcus (in: high G+C Gram-positive bacteria)]KQU02430.1 hypothetical protein ASG56_15720 [Rhodococcus sp. Leaf7]KQU37901.1 hypothetical protein ASG64_18450 [Rhodococcus sp. Leaf247]
MTGQLSPRGRALARVAADLFGERGYGAVGMDDIAAAVGTTGPSVYRHFDTKYDVLRAVHLDAARRLARPVQVHTPATLDTVAAGAVAVRRSLGTLRRDRRNLNQHDRTAVDAALGSVRRAVERRVASARPDVDSSALQDVTTSLLSMMSSIGTHRTSLAAGAITHLLDDAASRMLATPLPRRSTAVGPTARGIGAVGKREALVRSATELFATRDASEVTMADIASSVDLAPSSVYRYFGSKAAVLAEACLGAARRNAETTAHVLSDTDDPLQAVRTLVALRTLDASRSPGLRVMRSHVHQHDPEIRRRLAHMIRQDHAEWVHLVRLVDPQRRRAEVSFLVEAAFTVIDDMSRTTDAATVSTIVDALLDVGSQQ